MRASSASRPHPARPPGAPRPAGRARRWRAGLALAVALGALAAVAHAAGRTGELSPAATAQLRQAMVRLPPPPAWDKAADARPWTLDDLRAAFARVTDTPPEVDALHHTFLVPDEKWLKQFRGWFRTLEKKLDFHYEDQVWDCDNYANAFVAFADLLTLGAGESGRVCIGWASVEYQTPFAGVGLGAHAVVIAGTRQGLYVIEPQNGTMVPLREFPNRDTIVAVYF